MSTSLGKIVKDIEINKLKKLYNENKKVFDIVAQFIIKNKLLLYGGLTINLVLPKKLRFYKDYTLNDYDCYSKNALKTIMQLARILKNKGFKYIKIRRALHKETYRLYVNGAQVIDISLMDKAIYDKLYETSTMQKLKHYKDKFKVIPLLMIKRNLYFELARPERSGWRWEKVYQRWKLINQVYKTDKSKLVHTCVPIEDVYKGLVKKLLQFVKAGGFPIVDSYAIKLYLKMKNACCCRLNDVSKFLVILSDDYDKTRRQVVELISKTLDMKSFSIIIDDKSLYTDIMPARYGISILNKKTNKVFRIITIIQIKNECLSVQKINGFTVGSIDTILYLLYSYYILNMMNKESYGIADETLYFINKCEEYIDDVLMKGSIQKRLKTNCYGNVDIGQELMINWKQRMTVKYM